MSVVPSRKTNGSIFYKDDHEVVKTYEDPKKILDILSAEGTIEVLKGTICTFCSRSKQGRCSRGCWTPNSVCKRFSLVAESVDALSARLERTLKSLLKLRSRAA